MPTKQEEKAAEQSRAETDGASPGGATLSVTDNRTGKNYELEISDGPSGRWTCGRSSLGRRLRPDGLRPGVHEHGVLPLGDHLHRWRGGILQHRGIPIEQLSEHSTYLEVAYLLIFGELPTTPSSTLDLRRHAPHVRPRGHQEAQRGLPPRRPPDGDAARQRRSPLNLLSGGQAHRRSGERYMAAIRLIAKIPPWPPGRTATAWAFHTSIRTTSRITENFLSMLFKMENSYEPDPRLAKALDILFILHADHEQNCSTNAVRSGLLGVDPYSAVAAGWPRSTGLFMAAPTSRCCGCCGGSRPRRTSRASSRA